MLAHQQRAPNPITDTLCTLRDCGNVAGITPGENAMQTGYGPALLLGVLIGGAILLDDVITPERKGPPPRVAMFHHGEGVESVKNLTPGGDHNVWVIKGDDPVEAEIHKEIRIELASEEDAADEEQLMISVSVDADDEPAGDLAAAISAVIDTA